MSSRLRRRAAVIVLALLGATGSSFFPELDSSPVARAEPPARPPIYISFLWHMHQPIYFPYEDPTQTQGRGAYSFDLFRVHGDRAGPYTSWPADAVESGMNMGLPHAGAQVSFSGSLIENLDAYERNGWGFQDWKKRWHDSNWWTTSLGNPRLDLVGFGHHHPLLPLLDNEVGRRQITEHKQAYQRTWNGHGAPNRPYSKGFFTPENAFAEWIIPALKDEGVDWVFADNIHLQRACKDYPYKPGGNLIPPNRADQLNPDPKDWTQLRDLWAPTPVSAGWSFRPHRVRNIDPATGQAREVIVVPTARYMGNEDGRGGFGALLYEQVMSQLEFANNDPDHPILIVLHHDGDNYGGGSDSYYHANFQNFLGWAKARGHRFVPTTVQDYLEQFPPAKDDLVHVEPGSWSGADNGDAEFKKWLGDPGTRTNYSPDINSWASMTAAANTVKTAGSLAPNSAEQGSAWRYLLNGFASDYWYWDGTEIWDSNPTRAANLALAEARKIIGPGAPTRDQVPPQLFLPQREPYNPGALEFGSKAQPIDFKVWTLAYDVSDLASVILKFRVDDDGENPLTDIANETYAGGPGVGSWNSIAMGPEALPASKTRPQPAARAERYSAEIKGQAGKLIDYYVEATDTRGNTSRSPILHVYVGTAGAPAAPALTVSPQAPEWTDAVTITAPGGGFVRWGVNNWMRPPDALKTGATIEAGGVFETPLDANDRFVVGPFAVREDVTVINFVVRKPDGSWGKNQTVTIADKEVWSDKLRLDGKAITIFTKRAGQVRFGTDGWSAGSIHDAPLIGPGPDGVYEVPLGPFPSSVQSLEFAIEHADGSWNNNGGQDFRFRR